MTGVNKNSDMDARLGLAKSLSREAGEKALVYFRSIGDLVIQSKGAQDMVSNADYKVETFVRDRLAAQFPDDGIVGEEYGNVESRSGFTWVIDPIDGTANFVSAIPAWCVVLAVVHEDATKIAAIFDPCHDELFWGADGKGAYLNDAPMKVSATTSLNVGNMGVGMSGRTSSDQVSNFVASLVGRGGVFYRNASGALMLSYVAAGRLIGYAEPHMNAWDCLAGQLLIAEAGGCVEVQSANEMLEHGGRVVASAPAIFGELVEMANESFSR